jgi:dTDP-4-amino-4,6-dideoxygalactose transaminase
MPEAPPTAGLPIRWRDFLPGTTQSLEDGLAEFLHQPAVQIECSGTASLIVLLTTLKRDSSRHSVVVPAYTCPLVVLAIAHCGLKSVLCDLAGNHFDFCQRSLDQVVNDDTLAIIPTHLGGRVADLDCAMRIARQNGAWVIEDAAQALGATWRGKPVGTIADAGFYSLAVGKGLTLFEGGALVAHDEGLRRLLRETSAEIVPYRFLREVQRLAQLIGYAALYRPSALRFSYGMPLRRALDKGDLIAATGDNFSNDIPLHRVGAWRRAIGANALTRLPEFLKTTADQAAARLAMLNTIPGLTVIDDTPKNRGTWPLLMVLMPTEHARDAALARLWTAGLGVSRMFIHALPDYPYLASALDTAGVPSARDFAARMLTISNSLWLGASDFDRICSVLANVSHPGKITQAATADAD